jgi:adenylate cyclase
MERRLAAILAADVVGYSRLMGADEAGTLNRLKALRQEHIEPCIDEHRGRLVKLMGDGALIEFASAVDAVECAIAVQACVAARNRDLPERERLEFRIGINIGDVIVEGDDIYGDGVNIAARLEGLAEPGGVCVSGVVRDSVKNKLEAGFEDLGEKTVKNIAEPVRTYRVVTAAEASERPPAAAPTAGELPDKPAIAVLPFDNMSGDAEQDYFADGITEDIITALSRFQALIVIARNSVFTYKGQAVRVQDVARDLGVHYVVEGSVRKAGSRVRVTVQLVDAASGNHIWAERYDRDLIDVFDLQDELTQAIVATLPGRLESADVLRVKHKPISNLGAYDLVLRAKLCHHRGSREDNSEGLALLDKAIELDPDYASAYAWKACTLGQAMARGYVDDIAATDAICYETVKQGYVLDDNDIECLRILCEIRMEQARFDEAEQFNAKVFKLNPNDPRILAQRGELMTWLGRAEEGARWVETAMRIDPYEAESWAHLLGRALFSCQRYEAALEAFKHLPKVKYAHLAYKAACYAYLGQDEEARAQAADLLAMKPDFSAGDFVAALTYKQQRDSDHLLDGLRKAGLPA